ncbi:hypothetical protein [Marinobacter sp. F3R08]|uniref:hypothetical protein n=1 Tax=Marinobacter sp. F3R08 TaxID=2841559 RepID=UPI001C093B1F|nr:hypothetical protein [Marinobacter sp. F3R08]MBU2952176.1 hypothetical protein [Marinobacter sp. F3R08]
MTSNVIGLNGVSLATPVEEETANYTRYRDGSIRLTRRGLSLYGEASRRLGIDIRRICTVSAMQDLQRKAWDLMLSDVWEDDRVAENSRYAVGRLLSMGSQSIA